MTAPSPNKLARPLAIGLVVLAAFAVGAAIHVTGSPMQQRRERVDERRVEALQAITIEARSQALRNKDRLPASLDEMERPGVRLERQDPVTGAAYEYLVLDAETFQVCATFETDTSRNDRFRRYDPDWAHGVGRQCFERRVRKDDQARAHDDGV